MPKVIKSYPVMGTVSGNCLRRKLKQYALLYIIVDCVGAQQFDDNEDCDLLTPSK